MDETSRWARDFLLASRVGTPGEWEDIAEVAPSPDAAVIACTVTTRDRPDAPARRQVALVDPVTREARIAAPTLETRAAAWSADGRLALVADADGRSRALVLDAGTGATLAEASFDGAVEALRWSPDGQALALLVADAGAELSDLHGSGVVGSNQQWHPRVLPSPGGRRCAVVWVPPEAAPRRLAPELNTWELDWCGARALVAVVSEHGGEDDWYDARLVAVDARTGEPTDLLHPPRQVARPLGSTDGSRWAVISGAASDRDLLSGVLVVGDRHGGSTAVDTAGVHVTDLAWAPDLRVLFTGLRGVETVVGAVDLADGTLTEHWAAPETTGRHLPELAGTLGAAPLGVVESHRSAPALRVLGSTAEPALAATSAAAAARVTSRAADRQAVSWRSPDGTEIQGFLTLPDGAGPHPTIVDVHGGPLHAARNTWAGRDPYAAILVARGFAVLQPNPRGSVGRGPAFAEAVVGDMGGADADDIVSGARALVERGVADPRRLGITGVSYGGFMTAWLAAASDLFRAGVARSPCTDWVLFHRTSNIARFASVFLDGEPDDPQSQYHTRSPLQRERDIAIPLLLTSGLRDLACPPSQSQTLYAAIAERGVPAELAVYPEEGHDVKQLDALADQCARMVRWFERHLQPPA